MIDTTKQNEALGENPTLTMDKVSKAFELKYIYNNKK
jgi:hypothetical protein